ncbi:DUF2442 domain-containing protein [Daejeonella oryzae]|uniref:DUF2442 domain-containing protein n=1 Tax=Daejeonella oryzae TaxID=1122943 RepID=UPI0003F7B376|nr:DUF2442 domain-containing protein [Daejeonella oryzae]
MGLFTSRKQKQSIEIKFQNDLLFIKVADEKEIAYPLTWHPKLKNATQEEQQDWKIKEDGSGIHWNQLDIDITI